MSSCKKKCLFFVSLQSLGFLNILSCRANKSMHWETESQIPQATLDHSPYYNTRCDICQTPFENGQMVVGLLWLSFVPLPEIWILPPLLDSQIYYCSGQNAWQTLIAYDACIRLCLHAWARGCTEAPEFLRDECLVLWKAFGYATFCSYS